MLLAPLLVSACLSQDQRLYRQATEAGLDALCFEISDVAMRDSCIVEVASRTDNLRLCERITDRNTTVICYAILLPKVPNILDTEICEDIPSDEQYYKSVCYERFIDSILPTLQPAPCNEIVETRVLDWNPRLACFVRFGQQLEDQRICDYLQDISERKECVGAFVPR